MTRMRGTKAKESTIPLFPCGALTETLDFYRALGFEVLYQQEEPYLYAAVRRGGVELHFSKLTTWHSGSAVCLVFVPRVADYHRRFSDALRVKYGNVPTAGLPRITRFRKGHTRFHLFDPSGNVLLCIERDEPEKDYGWHQAERSSLASAIDTAVFLRDIYVNDKAAAQVLDKALGQNDPGEPVERARALAARAELAVAMGDVDRAAALRHELRRIPLSNQDRVRFHDELEAADAVERWRAQAGGKVRRTSDDTTHRDHGPSVPGATVNGRMR
jgi:hypothetical protein